MRQSTSWCISSRGEFFGVLSSNFSIFQSTRCSPTLEQRGAITALYLDTLDIEILVVVDKSLSIYLLFQEHIQGSSGVMRSCMFFSKVYLSIGRSTLIIASFSAQPFSGSVGQVDPPSFSVLPRLSRLDLRPLLSIFTRCISTPWIFPLVGFSAMYDMDLYSRYLL